MKAYEPSAIRNVALVGHGQSGKTTLTSACLFASGATNRLGRVEDGSATTDYTPEETEKKISLQLGVAHVEWGKSKIHLLDTPGDGNFIFEAKAALRAADLALVLLESVGGVEVQTERVWGFCQEAKIPRMVVVSRMDRDNASPARVLGAAREKLGRGVIPIQLPIGQEKGFRGVVDLVEMKAYLNEEDNPKPKPQDVPAEARKEAEEARRQLIEMVAEIDDDLMNTYLETETLGDDALIGGLARGLASGQLIPAVYTSSLHAVGIARLLDTIVAYGPSPEGRVFTGKNPRDGEVVERRGAVDEPFSAFVFKTIADPYTGKLSLLRVVSGKLSASDPLYNATREATERFGGFQVLQGKTGTAVEAIVAGDVVAIAKLKETTSWDTLCEKDHPVVYEPVSFPEPAISFAIEAKTRGDEDKLASALHRICEEDPTVRFARDPQTGEHLLSGMGDTHIDVVVGKLKHKFGVEVVLHTPKVPYRETIRKKAQVQGRHKKQTGGRGQFADCWIRMEPLPRGGGFEFADEIFGGSIPQNYRPAVEKGVLEAAARGFLAGFPVVDFKVTLYDGSYHDVDSSEMAFKIAGRLAFKSAMQQCGPVILEPIMNVTVTAPDEFMGDIIGQINTRRGRIQGMEGGIVTAQIPMAEMLSFPPVLKSITQGRGTYHMEMSHYDEVPAQAAQKIIEAAKHPEEEED